MTTAGLLVELRRQGVELVAAEDRLRFRAPAGALTNTLKNAIAVRRPELLEVLRADSPAAGLLQVLQRQGVEAVVVDGRLRYRAPAGTPAIEAREALVAFKPEMLKLLGHSTGSGPTTGGGIDLSGSKVVLLHAPSDLSTSPVGIPEPGTFGLARIPEESPADGNLSVEAEALGGSQNSQNPQNALGQGDSANIANCAKALAPPRSSASSDTHVTDGEAVATLGDLAFVYQKSWADEVLTGDTIAFDTETELIEGVAIPKLALASASSGLRHVLIHPERVGAFLLAHHDRHFLFHNVAFDFWVLDRHLRARGEVDEARCLWALADGDQLHDTMWLDALVRLAASDSYPRPRDLGTVSREYAGLEIQKDDPYRLRYGEIIGKPWEAVEPGFFSYAIKDAVATWRAYEVLRQKATDLSTEAGVSEAAIHKFGPLGEAIQVKGAIALADVTRQGLHQDLSHAGAVKRGLEERLAGQFERLRAEPDAADLFQLDKGGRILFTKNGAPRVKQKVLRQILRKVADRIAAETESPLHLPTTTKGEMTISAKEWSDYTELDPFVREWVAMAETAKLVQFFAHLEEPVVHPSYTVMVRTGRTSCSGPNIQQVPRKGGFREIFVAPAGHGVLAADYSFIELRTLAAECEARYGNSKLADVIRAGVDPHCYTAAMLLGVSPEEFMALEHADPERFERQRQQAKPLNFGIPGGLGVASLVHYARSTYGVDLSEAQANSTAEADSQLT